MTKETKVLSLNDLDRLEMYPEGRARLEDCIDWGFKTRDQIRHESNESYGPKIETVGLGYLVRDNN